MSTTATDAADAPAPAGPLPTSPAPRGERSQRRQNLRDTLARADVRFSPYLYISPFFLLFAIVGLFPLVYTAFVSMHDWHLIGGQGDFVGFANYIDVVQQPRFLTALRNTFSIFLLSSVPQVLAAIVILAILDANLRAKTFWRMGVLLPYVVAPVAVALIFSRLFADQAGLINSLLGEVGISPIRWHADPLSSHVAIATMVNFRWTGYNTLIFLAAMQAIPRDVFEAAVLDGAGRLRQFVSVTVPMLRPTIIFIVITSTIGGLQIFDEPRMFDQLGQGGADRQWMTVTMFLYELGWGSQKSFGRAAAVAWILFLIIVLIGMINFLITQRIASSGGHPTVNKAAARAMAKSVAARSATTSSASSSTTSGGTR